MKINSFDIVTGKIVIRFTDDDGKEKRLRISAENVLQNWQAAQQSEHLTAFGVGTRARFCNWLASLGERIAQSGGR